MSGLIILLLALGFMVLFYLVFRSPTPGVDRLGLFLVWLAVGGLLAYFFAVRVLNYDPDPARLAIARLVTGQKIIDLSQIVPGLPEDLDMIMRIDTDGEPERIADRDAALEWLVFYRYDGTTDEGIDTSEDANWIRGGPLGGAIYDSDGCRPPAIRSYELIPLAYDYIAQDGILLSRDPRTSDVVVENAINWRDTFAGCLQPADEESGPDRPEIFIYGRTGSVRTDLNVFRKTGQELSCILRQQWEQTNPGMPLPCPVGYQNIGSFRGNYRVARNGAEVRVYDRAPFERSQFVIKKTYLPSRSTGTYLTASGVLTSPVGVSIEFGPGRPEDTQEVYYPEKTVLAFFTQLGDATERAMQNVCRGGKNESVRYDPAMFGLSLPANRLENVVVCEISYQPNIERERNHQTQYVGVRVVEQTEAGHDNCRNSVPLICEVRADPSDPTALPYGCKWCLAGCVPAP